MTQKQGDIFIPFFFFISVNQFTLVSLAPNISGAVGNPPLYMPEPIELGIPWCLVGIRLVSLAKTDQVLAKLSAK